MRARRGRILVRGITVLRLGTVLAALLLLPPLVRRDVPGIPAALVAVAVVAAASTVRDRWWIVRIHRQELEAALTRSCLMARAMPAITDHGVRVQLRAIPLLIRIRGRGSHAFELRFDGPWQAHRKAVLVRSTIAKQFEPLLPRIRIRLRRARATTHR